MSEQCPFQYDLLNPATYNKEIPFEYFKTLRKQCPVALQNDTLKDAQFWAITRREDLDFVSKNPKLFSSRENLAHPQTGSDDPQTMELMRNLIINMDPPDHIKYRRIVRNAFTGKAVDALEPQLKEFAKNIIDKIAAKGECEFVSEVSAEMPLFVICALMEMPSEKRQQFSDLVNVMLGMDDPDISVTAEDGQLAAAQLFEIAMELAAKHKTSPTPGSVLDALLNGIVEGENLSEFEFCSFFLILIAGGVETTRTATSQGMRLLIEHPEQLQMLIDNPELIPDAIEEILRFYPPFVHMHRTAMEDIKIGDMNIKQGDKVVLFYPSVNHEEEVFGEDAGVFDITRGQRTEDLKNQHRTFGIGQHFCLGSHLARKELKIMFEEIIPRLRNPKLVNAPKNLMSNFIVGVKEMRITFDAEQ